MKNTQALLLDIPFEGVTLHLVSLENRPYISINPLCAAMSMNKAVHAQRIKRLGERHGFQVLESVVAEDDVWHLLPLELLAWFLWTLQSSDEDAGKLLAYWRKALALHAMTEWANWRDRNARLSHAAAPTSQKKRPGVSADLVEEWRKMHEQGHPLSKIAKKYGFSTATISLCLRGKYPGLA